jgi:hypothetical protein
LKDFIEETLLPDYLFIQHAYDLGIDEDFLVRVKIKEFAINLLANNHPIKFESMTILDEQMQDFYEKQRTLYDVDLIQADSYEMADSMYRYLSKNRNVKLRYYNPDLMGLAYPRFHELNKLTYGSSLHPDVLPALIVLNPGEVSEPVYTPPLWSLIRLKDKKTKRKMDSFEKMEKELLEKAQGLFKYAEQNTYVEELKKAYELRINKELYKPVAAAYTPIERGGGYVDMNKIDPAQRDAVLIQLKDDTVTIREFAVTLNLQLQFIRMKQLSRNDLEAIVDGHAKQYLLYLDALENGVQEKTGIKDQLVNKEHRILLTEYLKKEIGDKVSVSDSEARKYYEDNRDNYTGDFVNVERVIKGELRSKKLMERKEELVDKLRKKYTVRYNQPLLLKVCDILDAEKQRRKNIFPKSE